MAESQAPTLPETGGSSEAAEAAATAANPSTRPLFRAFMEGSQALTRVGKAIQQHFAGDCKVYSSRPEVFSAASEKAAASIASEQGGQGGKDEPPAHIVWENTPKQFNKILRDRCLTYNHLDNAAILEDKTGLARLQEHMPCKTLKGYVVRGRREFLALADRILPPSEQTEAAQLAGPEASAQQAKDLVWVVKDPMANSAEGVWFFTRSNYQRIAMHLADEEPGTLEGEGVQASNAASSSTVDRGSKPYRPSRRPPESGYAIQQFVSNPALFRGRKYHIRTYNLVLGDGSAFINRHAFLHVANKPYSLAATANPTKDTEASSSSVIGVGGDSFFDQEIFLTNCCANKSSKEFAGEICIDLDSAEWSAVFDRMLVKWRALLDTAAPFMKLQRSAYHFEFVGVDWIVGTDGAVWLIECNCPPCTDTATGLPEAEALHDRVARDIVRLVIDPALRGNAVNAVPRVLSSSTAAPAPIEAAVPRSDVAVASQSGLQTGFVCCRRPREGFVASPPIKLAFNSFAWSKFVRDDKKRVHQQLGGHEHMRRE